LDAFVVYKVKNKKTGRMACQFTNIYARTAARPMKSFFQNHQKKSAAHIAAAKTSKNFSRRIHPCPEAPEEVFPVPGTPLAAVQRPEPGNAQGREVAAEKLNLNIS